MSDTTAEANHLKNPEILNMLEDWTDEEIKGSMADLEAALALRDVWDKMSDEERSFAWESATKAQIQHADEDMKWDI